MFDDTGDYHDDDRNEFERRIDAANSILTGAGEETIGEAEEDIIANICDDDGLMDVDAIVVYVRGDRKQRALDGIPSGSM